MADADEYLQVYIIVLMKNNTCLNRLVLLLIITVVVGVGIQTVCSQDCELTLYLCCTV